MDIALWIASGLLALVNLGAGAMKLIRPKAALLEMGPPFAWAGQFGQGQIRLIALAEVLAAIGLVVPHATGILPVLSPLAAVGVVALQAGAIVTHARRGEAFVVNAVILVLALLTAIGLFITL